MMYCIRILLSLFPLLHKDKRTVVKSFKLTRQFQQISGFLLNTSEKEFFSKKFFWGGGMRFSDPMMRGTWGFLMLWCRWFFWCGDGVTEILWCCGDLKLYGVLCLCFSCCGFQWNEIVCGAGVFDLPLSNRNLAQICHVNAPLKIIICNKILICYLPGRRSIW